MPISKFRPSFTFTEDRLAELRAVVPEAFADGKANWDVLREALGEHLEDEGANAEHFGLSWPGKREARRLAAMPSKGTLVPVRGEGVNEDKTRNIFIEGDNLEVLKLLQKSYAGQVKMIYIDPPYNTGSDFVYRDDFSEPLEQYLRLTGQADEAGVLLTTNPRAAGRYHSNWLSMMYPRLRLAKTLLRDDGVIFVSIDDNEVQNLKALLEEVFGSENFVAQIVVQSNPRGRQSEKFVATVHEYLLIFAKSITECELYGASLTEDQLKEFKYQDERGEKYRLLGLRQRGSASRRQDRPKMYYPIYVDPSTGRVSLQKSPKFSTEVLPRKSTGDDGRWMWGREKVQRELNRAEARLIGSRDEWDVFVRDYLNTTVGEERTRKFKTIWDDKELNYQNGTQEIKRLFGEGVIDFPKPTSLLQQIVTMANDPDGLFLDFFAGSCTTAHAIFQLNMRDGGNRRFIMIQLPEQSGNSKFPTISDIGKQRLRLAIKEIESESKGKMKLDPVGSREKLGFRAFKLHRSNLSPWQDFTGDDPKQLELLFESTTSPLTDGWEPENVLTEIQLLEGFPIDSTVTELTEYKKNKLQLVESDACAYRLLICLDKMIRDDTLERIQMDPDDVFVCLDSALTDEAKVRLGDLGNLRVI